MARPRMAGSGRRQVVESRGALSCARSVRRLPGSDVLLVAVRSFAGARGRCNGCLGQTGRAQDDRLAACTPGPFLTSGTRNACATGKARRRARHADSSGDTRLRTSPGCAPGQSGLPPPRPRQSTPAPGPQCGRSQHRAGRAASRRQSRPRAVRAMPGRSATSTTAPPARQRVTTSAAGRRMRNQAAAAAQSGTSGAPSVPTAVCSAMPAGLMGKTTPAAVDSATSTSAASSQPPGGAQRSSAAPRPSSRLRGARARCRRGDLLATRVSVRRRRLRCEWHAVGSLTAAPSHSGEATYWNRDDALVATSGRGGSTSSSARWPRLSDGDGGSSALA